uniref:Uncharacterized protein n=1 Tax=Equus asinus TaxID=9793 RepID=A0A8C4LUA6_EQUAS
MSTSSPGVKDLDSPPAVVYHHDAPRLGTQRQPGRVDQGPPAAEGSCMETSGLLPTLKWQCKNQNSVFQPWCPALSSSQSWVLGARTGRA